MLVAFGLLPYCNRVSKSRVFGVLSNTDKVGHNWTFRALGWRSENVGKCYLSLACFNRANPRKPLLRLVAFAEYLHHKRVKESD